jgi:hypothetical protein
VKGFSVGLLIFNLGIPIPVPAVVLCNLIAFENQILMHQLSGYQAKNNVYIPKVIF